MNNGQSDSHGVNGLGLLEGMRPVIVTSTEMKHTHK